MLTFKRGNNETLNNTPITKDMLYFTTDNHGIYMDSSDTRYKIFGINGTDDKTSSVDSVSKNTFFDKNSHLFLTKDDVATDGDTTNKIAIGNGYYSNIIGDNYRDYFGDNSITSVLKKLQSINSHSSILWVNYDLAHTWSSDLAINQTSNEHIEINIPKSYFSYSLLVQQKVNNGTINEDGFYYLMFYELPKSIATITRKSYGVEYYLRQGDTSSTIRKSILYGELWLEVISSSSNVKTLKITKLGHLVEDEGSVLTPNNVEYSRYLVPVALSGWEW